MPCYQPRIAWRLPSGAVAVGNEYIKNASYMEVPCTKCEGCQQAHARAWALRCKLELQQHNAAVFTTLTYAPDREPITLTKRHLQLWIKRLRKQYTLRYFLSGEYGEHTQRPHYHAILFGLSEQNGQDIEDKWGLGHCRTYPANEKTIAYTAGYTGKKTGWNLQAKEERIDPETGELYTWQPPFIEMSTNPGIGAHAKQWPDAWRLYAINNGQQVPVPRYLHDSWRKQATEQQLQQLREEKIQKIRQQQPETLHRYQQQQEARKRNAQARQKEQAEKRAI